MTIVFGGMRVLAGLGAKGLNPYGSTGFFGPRPSAGNGDMEGTRGVVPANDSGAETTSLKTRQAAGSDLSEGERSVLAQERALKASAGGARTATTYTYEIGPDGKSYIVGAEVSVTGTEEELDAVSGGGRAQGTPKQGSDNEASDSTKEEKNESKSASTEEDPQVRAAIAELQSIEREVIAHEAAHMAVGGQFAGSASYSYTTGPDGKKYITGGEVPISTPATDDPEEALRSAEQVARAALAPAKPSSQDHAVAAGASQIAAEARARMASEKSKETDPKEDKEGKEDGGKTSDAYTARKATDAYAATGSPNGLWIAASNDDRYTDTITDSVETAA